MAWVERLAPTSTAAFELGGAIMLLVHDHWIVASLLLVLLSVPPIIRATAEQTRALGQKAYLEFCGKARLAHVETNSKYDLAEYASNLINNTDIPYENSAIPPIPNELNDHDPLKLSLEMEKIEDFNLKDSIPEGLFTKLFRK